MPNCGNYLGQIQVLTYSYPNATTVTTPVQYCYGTATNAVTYQNIYYNYQYQYQYQGQWNVYGQGLGNVYQITPEMKAASDAQEAKRKEATKKAEELLLLHLTDEQKKQYLEFEYFETTVDDRVYRIKKGRAGNVYLIDNGKPKFKYCAHPNDYTPDGDAMLAQLLMLKTDEAGFIKTANRTILV
jgi:hypothetical protein